MFKFYNINYNSNIDFFKYGLFIKSSKRFFNDKLSVSFGVRTDQDNFTSENKIFENISPRLALSLSLSRNKKWNLNLTSGRYYKMPTYTSLGFRDLNNMLIKKIQNILKVII